MSTKKTKDGKKPKKPSTELKSFNELRKDKIIKFKWMKYISHHQVEEATQGKFPKVRGKR
jgi:hypothetical protein